jgi:hypothetical protein
MNNTFVETRRSARFASRVGRCTLALVLFSLPGSALLAHQPATVRLSVDCDAGDDLESAVEGAFAGLPQAPRRNPGSSWLPPRPDGARGGFPVSDVIVTIEGTCTANLEVPAHARLVLEGVDRETSRIQGELDEGGAGVGRVVSVSRSAELVLGNLTISGGTEGVLAEHATVRIKDSVFRDNFVAVSVNSSETLMTGCVIESDSDGPAILAVQGILSAFQTDILGTGSGLSGKGILAELGATVLIESCNIDGRHVALSARRGAYVEAAGLTTSSESVEVEVLEDSYVSVRSSVLGGALKANMNSTVLLVSTELAGDVSANAFGRLVIIEGSQVGGSLFCDATSDAQCHDSSVAGTSFCNHCQVVPFEP